MSKSFCWASSLGSCSSRSGEHIVTKAIFSDAVYIRGFNWCPTLKKIGIQSFVTNRLCKKHNNDLSEIDSVGEKFWSALKNLMEHKNGTPTLIDGQYLERWALKCVSNMLAAHDKSWQPDDLLVKIIFGFETIPEGAGLGFIAAIGDQPSGEDHIQIGTLLINNQLHGACLKIRGIDIIVTYNFPTHRLRHPDYPEKKPIYRLRKIDHAKTNNYIELKF